MQIYCPQCHTGYNVPDELIPEEGRKLRCSSCKEVFKFDRTGMSEIITPETSDKSDIKVQTDNDKNSDHVSSSITDSVEETPIESSSSATEDFEISFNDIFERLNEQSERLFQEEQELPFKRRIFLQFKTMLGLNRKFNFKLIGLIIFLIVMVCTYNYRYEIVRKIPFTNKIYKALGIRAQIPGEGLEFQNVNWNYITNNGVRSLEIKGYINNPTHREIDIPTVHIEILDENALLLQSINQKPSISSLKADGRIAIGVIVKTPSPTAKYVYMTFIDVD